MSITSWDPFRELEEMNNRLNRVISRSVPARSSASKDALTVFDWAPTVDIAESTEEYQIRAELPDVKKEDIKVSVDNGTLRIEGERRQEKEEKGKRWHRVERSYGSFLRTFVLPDNADGAKMSAEYKNGMLDVRLPKAAKALPKTIEIKGG
jgi:HSP20 family protein